jgi:hypothetical protein
LIGTHKRLVSLKSDKIIAEDNENRNEAIKECRTSKESNDEQNMISLCICDGTIK